MHITVVDALLVEDLAIRLYEHRRGNDWTGNTVDYRNSYRKQALELVQEAYDFAVSQPELYFPGKK